ncbi:MAG: hypothetical protein KKG13_04985 [Nanoarchaeota archaeon]|nr:hypothetical protein [Nanoarchaeota archaeon]
MVKKEGIKEYADHIHTGIDMLLEIVKKHKKIRLTEAAEMLNVSENRIEEWGKILEDHNLITMHYPIMGEPTLETPIIVKVNETKEERRKEENRKKQERKKEEQKKKEMEKLKKENEKIRKNEKEKEKDKTEKNKIVNKKTSEPVKKPFENKNIKKHLMPLKLAIPLFTALIIAMILYTLSVTQYSYSVQDLLNFLKNILSPIIPQIQNYLIIENLYLVLIVIIPIIIITIGLIIFKRSHRKKSEKK